MQKTCTCGFLHGAETNESLIQEVDKALEGQQEYQGEVCFYRKSGEKPRGLNQYRKFCVGGWFTRTSRCVVTNKSHCLFPGKGMLIGLILYIHTEFGALIFLSELLFILILFFPKISRKCLLVPAGYCSNQKRERWGGAVPPVLQRPHWVLREEQPSVQQGGRWVLAGKKKNSTQIKIAVRFMHPFCGDMCRAGRRRPPVQQPGPYQVATEGAQPLTACDQPVQQEGQADPNWRECKQHPPHWQDLITWESLPGDIQRLLVRVKWRFNCWTLLLFNMEWVLGKG